jgi:sec-independent protein translocase protein TatA
MGAGMLQPMHLIIVLGIVLLIFGPGKLPELGRAVGDGMRELKRASNGGEQDARQTRLQPQPVAAAAATVVACRGCAAPLVSNARFCGVCGARAELTPLESAVL